MRLPNDAICGMIPQIAARNRIVSARRNPTPSYLPHKQSGRGRAIWYDASGTRKQKLLPGLFDSSESRTAFARLQLELETAPLPASAETGTVLSVNEMLLAFLDHAERHYRDPDGNLTTEVNELKLSIAPVRELYGLIPAAEFGPRALAAIRQHMIRENLCRTLINRRVDRVKRVFKWAASEELVPVSVHQALLTLAGLRAGRSEARESKPVLPVDPAHVNSTIPFLNRHVRAMVELNRLTGMRPGEVCGMKLSEVDSSGELWLYRPIRHKTAHHGKERVIPFGPRARAVLTEFLTGDNPPPEGFDQIDTTDDTARLVAADAYQEANRERDAALLRDLNKPVVFMACCVVDPTATLFSPKEAREEKFRIMRANRKSKVQPSQADRRSSKPKRQPRERYSTERYANTVRDAAEKAGVPHWHPNQLRHLFATAVRKGHGLEAAQVLLGHSRANITQLYAERNEALASAVAAKIG